MYKNGEGSNNNTTGSTRNSNSNDHKYNVLYWSDVVGIPFIEADTKNKQVHVKDWPNIDFRF